MSDTNYVSKVEVSGSTYNIHDNNAQEQFNTLADTIVELQNKDNDLDARLQAVENDMPASSEYYAKSVNNIKANENGNIVLAYGDVNAASGTDFTEHIAELGTATSAGHVTVNTDINYKNYVEPAEKDNSRTASIDAISKMGKEIYDLANNVSSEGCIKDINGKTTDDGSHSITLSAKDMYYDFDITEEENMSIKDKLDEIDSSLENIDIEPNPDVPEETTEINLTDIKIGTNYYKITGSGGGTEVVANPEEDATSDLNKIQIGENVYSVNGGGSIIPNPEEESTDTLEKLKINDTVYELGGGTNVEANPSAEATESLTKITVGESTYSIDGGVTSVNSKTGAITLANTDVGAAAAKHTHVMDDITDLEVGNKVSVSATGTATTEVQYIKIDDVEYKLAGSGGGGGSSSLAGLSDVELSATPSENQVLTYDADNSKWINADATGGTSVEANPEASAEDENLTSIKIGEDVYKISTEIDSINADKVSVNITELGYKSNNVQDILASLNKGVSTNNYYLLNGGIQDIGLTISLYDNDNVLIKETNYPDPIYWSTKFELICDNIKVIGTGNENLSIYAIEDSTVKIKYNNSYYNPGDLIITTKYPNWSNFRLDEEPNVVSGAEFINYDKVSSGLEATNVQSAIDELNTKLNSLTRASESEDTF